MCTREQAVVETPFDESEKVALVKHVNWALRGDPHVGELLELDPHSGALFEAAAGGLLLAKMVKHVDDEAVDARALNKAEGGKKLGHEARKLDDCWSIESSG